MALLWTVYAKNELLMDGGFSPNQLVLGKNSFQSNLLDQHERGLREDNTREDQVAQNMRVREDARVIHNQQECDKRLQRALRKPIRPHPLDEIYLGAKVMYKREKDKVWKGPAKVVGLDGKTVLVKQGGYVTQVQKVHITRVKQDDCSEAEMEPQTHSIEMEEESEDEFYQKRSKGCHRSDQKKMREEISEEGKEDSEATETMSVSKGKRYEVRNNETSEIKCIRILGRAGKATSL